MFQLRAVEACNHLTFVVTFKKVLDSMSPVESRARKRFGLDLAVDVWMVTFMRKETGERSTENKNEDGMMVKIVS
ncbi:hypothetical protein BOTCAL_0273g00110 [Botryotinia calthae]|uniref:Uncharacterized protein n=1 Tax=Botryotinia calthae TaxID=38488 RepID=A0A4Y8CY89_9HELO|nr:hypothetical protein BOTCAL_0273g00110 [Botryotinia calthae]